MQESVEAVEPRKTSKTSVISGRVLSTLVVLMLIMSGVMKIVQPGDFAEQFSKSGFPVSVAKPIGIVELICTALYVIPQTSVLGAILLTGYLGGATATHVRLEQNFAAPVIIGVVVWLGLFLRDHRIRDLAPIRKLPGR